ncbi:MAG: glycohydrolase toxin TNT-related protein [Chromatiaceae bacterium]|nr:glycohydrolase toxin TNT-related protein [Chromatiaceae bacterium]
MNPYTYVSNSPQNFTDPLGLVKQAKTARSGLSSAFSGYVDNFMEGYQQGTSVMRPSALADLGSATRGAVDAWTTGVKFGLNNVATGIPAIRVPGTDISFGTSFGAVRSLGGISQVAKGASTKLTTYFPENNGFLGSTTKITLKPGQIIDRFGGSDISRFFSPAGTPAVMRALPPGTAQQPLRTFEVLKPVGVESGQVAPAFNQIGLGTQFRSSQSDQNI